MERYIAFKMIKAAQMSKHDFQRYKGEKSGAPYSVEGMDEAGYMVVYPDNYESWSPKEVFEQTHMQIAENCTITYENVEEFIADMKVSTAGDKTTIVRATLMNGFEIVESSSCVDPENYDEAYGAELCEQRIKDKIWTFLGFLLQTAKYGMKR